MLAIERKFSGVRSSGGIAMSKAASMASIRSTMAIEFKPLSTSPSVAPIGRFKPLRIAMSLTTWAILLLTIFVLASNTAKPLFPAARHKGITSNALDNTSGLIVA